MTNKVQEGKEWLGVVTLVAAVALCVLYFVFHTKTPDTISISPTVPPSATVASTSSTESAQLSPAHAMGKRTKTTDCIAHQPLPDKDCTPGQAIKGVTKEQVCTPGYSQSVRNVPESVKKQVYAEYGILTHTTGEYEVDHQVSLELGGSNDISNLWPEPAEPRPGFHEKDKVENYLHKQVCDGKMSLEEAQVKIANNWLEVYQAITP